MEMFRNFAGACGTSAVTVNETFNTDETIHPSKISLALNESSRGGRREAYRVVVLTASPKISTFGALK